MSNTNYRRDAITRPVYRYTAKRPKMNVKLINEQPAKVGGMQYLMTALFISIILLTSMSFVDTYYDSVLAKSLDEITSVEITTRIVKNAVDQVSVEDQITFTPEPELMMAQSLPIVEEFVVDTVVSDADDKIQLAPPTPEELEFIERIVEAEVTGTQYKYDGQHVNEEQMLEAKIRVCQVFLNRVYDQERFSNINTLYEAMSYPNASSTVNSGRYLEVEVTDMTRQAVQIALDPETEDLTDGALFFLAGGVTENPYGDYLFTDAVGHSFFK